MELDEHFIIDEFNFQLADFYVNDFVGKSMTWFKAYGIIGLIQGGKWRHVVTADEKNYIFCTFSKKGKPLPLYTANQVIALKNVIAGGWKWKKC